MQKVICFDLYNTLMSETRKSLMEVSSGECHQEIMVSTPDYLDYFVEQYGEKYALTKDSVYEYVRNNLMCRAVNSFEEMTQLLFSRFLLNEPCTTRKLDSVANSVEWYWRFGSGSAEWIEPTFPEKLVGLRNAGHKVVLVSNCTLPAWKKVRDKVEKYFNFCFISALEGVSKPDQRVWEKIESWFPEIARDEFTMVGDNESDDLMVPRSRGWKTIHAKEMWKVFKEEK